MQNSQELQQLLEVCQREGCLLCRLAHFQQACELKLPGSSEATGEWLAQLRQLCPAQLGEPFANMITVLETRHTAMKCSRGDGQQASLPMRMNR